MTNIRGRLSGDNWSTANVYGMGIFGDVFSISPMPHTTNSTQGMGENIGRLGSQGFLSDSCDSCISPQNGGFDVRWVRFPKHIPLFPALSQLEPLGFWNFSDRVQRCLRELVVDTTV